MIVVNGRFTTRAATGVDVHAAEVLRHLTGFRLVVPGRRWTSGARATIWEQAVFGRATRTGQRRSGSDADVLWSPCNTGPVTRRPHVITVQDVGPLEHPEWYSRRYAWRTRLLDARAIRRASAVAAGSAFSAERIADVVGVPSERIHVVGSGVRHEVLSIDPAEPVEDPPSRPQLVALGSITAWKGQDRLVEAFHRVRPDADLVLIGGTNTSVMSAAARSLVEAGDSRVRLTGRLPTDEVLATLRSAAACFALSRYEGFDLPPVEAAALGVPTVVSDIPVHRETLGGVDGVHVVASDAELDEAVRAAAAGDLSRPSADEVRMRHRWEDVGRRYVRIFRDELGDPDVHLTDPSLHGGR